MDDIRINKKGRKGLIFTIIFNVLVVGYIVVKEIFKEAGAFQTIDILNIKYIYIICGIACFLTALFADYVKYKKMISTCEEKTDRRGAFNVSVLGKYYDNVTPLGAGGQPFQINYLLKRGYSTGTGAAIPVVGFLSQQLAFVIIAAVVFILNNSSKFLNNIVDIRILAFLGLAFYLFVPAMILFFVCFPKPFHKMVCAFTRFLGKIRIIKDGEKTAKSICDSINEYVASIKMMGKKPFLLFELMFFSLIYQAAILSIPFFMLRAFGGTNDWRTIFSLTVYIYAAITIIPTPGNAGAAEFSFRRVFATLEGGYLFWAMILWRFLVYYMWIIIGFTLVMKNAFVGKKAEKKPKRRAASKKCEKNPVPKEGPLGILLFVDRFLPYMDGVVRTVDAYAREMVAMGHNVAVVCPRGKTERKCGAPYRILHVPTVFLPFFKFPIAIPLRTKRIKRYFEENKVDVIHSHSPFIMGSLAKRLGKKYKIPVISSFHSKYYDDVLNITHSKIISRKVVDIIVGHYRSIDRVWACSEGAADTLRGYGYDKDIDVMINGVEKMPDGDREDLKNAAIERLSLPKDKKILLFVGQQIWHKNLKLVIDVSNNIKQTHPDTVTVIVGEGYNAESIKNYAKRVGASNVIFKGAVKDRSLLYGVYLSSHILFFPSVYDTSGLVIREAAMAGVPSLLVKGANTAEVVEDGVNGFLAENSEAAMTEKIKEILSLPDIGKTGENAAKTIPVTWDTIARAAVEKYRNGLT